MWYAGALFNVSLTQGKLNGYDFNLLYNVDTIHCRYFSFLIHASLKSPIHLVFLLARTNPKEIKDVQKDLCTGILILLLFILAENNPNVNHREIITLWAIHKME